MKLSRKIVSGVLVLLLTLAGMLMPQSLYGCPAYERCRAEADERRRAAQNRCGLASGISAAISCTAIGALNLPAGGVCGLVYVWLDSQCDEQAERTYEFDISTCRATYVLGPGCD